MKAKILAIALASGLLFGGINSASFAQDNSTKKTTKTETKVEHKNNKDNSKVAVNDTKSTKTGHHKKHRTSKAKVNKESSSKESSNKENTGTK